MYVPLGGGRVVDIREVVAILDARRLGRSADARALLGRARSGSRPGAPGREPPPRAVVVTTSGLAATPLAPATLARRLGSLRRAWARGLNGEESGRTRVSDIDSARA